jgi:anti-sigma factor RsiW
VSHIDSDTIALIALGESGAPVDNEHIAQCPKCQSELDEVRSVVASARSITDADRPVTPPDSVWLGIETAIVPSAAPSQGTPAKRNRGAGWYALAASVGVVIGGLATFIAMQSPTSTQTPSVIAQASLEPLRDVESMVSVGMLDSSEGGTFTLPAGLDLNQFPVVDISLEHFDGDTSHSADSILRGKLEI